MVIFRWRNELETNIEIIDQQHRQIIEHANAFFIGHKCGNDLKTAEGCLAFLQQYIQYHFQAEEAFQVECAYLGYRAHQARHIALATRVKFLTVQLAESQFAATKMEEFYLFLTEWIQEHVLLEDMAFAVHYKKSRDSTRLS